MYNRYIRNDQGSYTRIPREEPTGPSAPQGPEARGDAHTPPPFQPVSHDPGPDKPPDGLTGFLRHLLDQLHMDHVDTGDLLLLALLFFLFREDADEELLVALGLLLIL